jgi:UDP-perosamine 4-acetyltransferase
MDVLIVGAGGHGKVVREILLAAGKHRPIGFIDANPSLAGSIIAGLPVFGHINALPKLRSRCAGAIIAIGDNRTRQTYATRLIEHGFELVQAIHPAATVAPSARLGRNVVVAASAVISTEASVGDHAIINTAAVLDHESHIGEAAHVCPGVLLAGRVRIGARAFIGLGAKVIQCLSIGEDAIVGAGAVVIADLPESVTAVGVPARVIRQTAQAAVPLGV